MGRKAGAEYWEAWGWLKRITTGHIKLYSTIQSTEAGSHCGNEYRANSCAQPGHVTPIHGLTGPIRPLNHGNVAREWLAWVVGVWLAGLLAGVAAKIGGFGRFVLSSLWVLLRLPLVDPANNGLFGLACARSSAILTRFSASFAVK